MENNTNVLRRLMMLLVCGLCLTLTIFAAPGNLDLTFDTDGIVTTPFSASSTDDGASVAVQTDGKIVVGGSSDGDFALARYNTDGSLDTTFGTGGKVVTAVSIFEDYILAIAIQPDGKIVAVGYANNGANDDIAIARYNSDGSLDVTFDGDSGTGNGKFTTAVGAGDDFGFGVAVQSSGITVAGSSDNGGGRDFIVVRYKPDGTLDGGFDGDGKVITPVGGVIDQARAIVIQPDNKIVVTGETLIGANYRFATARYNSNGSLDFGFGMSGIAITTIGTNDFPTAVAIQPDGFIVAAGYTNTGGNLDFALVRYKADGNLDMAFDGDGKVTTPIGSASDIAEGVAIQSTGKIVAGGFSSDGISNDFALVRYNANGSLDTGFGAGGKVTTPFGTQNDIAFGLAIQPADNKIILAGATFTGTSDDFAIARYLSDPSAGFLYVIKDSTAGNQIYGFSVNETTGALTSLASFPVATGGTGSGFAPSEQIIIDRANNRLFVINDGSDTVSAYSINPTTGALTVLPFSPISLGTGSWNTIAVHPSGSPLIVGNGNLTPVVKSYTITSTTATEAAGSPFSVGLNVFPFSSVFSRNGNFFYTGGNGGTVIAGFSVNPASGVLTTLLGSPFNSGNNNPVGYATDTQGRLFTVSLNTGGELNVFTTMSGIPAAAAGNPFASGLTQAADGVLHPNEQFYFAANRAGGANSVGSYQISGSGAATTLTAVAGSPFPSGGVLTTALVTNQTGTFLFAANGFSRNLTTYGINPTNGVLTNIGIQPADTLGAAGTLTGIAYYTEPFAPLAASVSVSGRVTTASGRGISGARVTLTDYHGETRTTLTGSFGYYRFDDVQVGETYIFEITHKRFQFASQVVTVNEEIEELNFAPTDFP
ncbi:hypothetical protein BH10ACI1_BH10ACI1_03810 [soil metagenome]